MDFLFLIQFLKERGFTKIKGDDYQNRIGSEMIIRAFKKDIGQFYDVYISFHRKSTIYCDVISKYRIEDDNYDEFRGEFFEELIESLDKILIK